MIQNINTNYKSYLNDTKITLQMYLGHFTEKKPTYSRIYNILID